MPVTSLTVRSRSRGTPKGFRYDLFVKQMDALGHDTEEARAQAAGISRQTLHRWKSGGRVDLSLKRARAIARKTGLSVDELFPPEQAA